jgi:plastocyanin
MRSFSIGSAATIALVALLGATGSISAAGSAKTLVGTVGPGFTITMNKKSVPAGTYKFTVHDLSPMHDFHLTGAGVNKTTSVGGKGTTTWVVKLKKGTYTFVCDPHRSFMVGTLKVT